jgi:hypothetical protein
VRITLESTATLATLVVEGREIPVRLWQGTTSTGVPCVAFVTRLAFAGDAECAEPERDLIETTPLDARWTNLPRRIVVEGPADARGCRVVAESANRGRRRGRA